jgi:ASC-1-like (ASCH) protein
LLDEIIAGRKTIEGRLNRGKFAEYRPGDQVWLRRDYRTEDGTLRDGKPRQVLVEILAVRQYRTSVEMAMKEGFTKLIPNADTPEEAAAEYNKYYSAEDQAKYGVLAIEFKLLSHV